MKTPIFRMTPDYTPVMRLMAMQTRFAIETSQSMMKLAMLPWSGLPAGFGSICAPMGSAKPTTADTKTKSTETKAPAKPAAPKSVKTSDADETGSKVVALPAEKRAEAKPTTARVEAPSKAPAKAKPTQAPAQEEATAKKAPAKQTPATQAAGTQVTAKEVNADKPLADKGPVPEKPATTQAADKPRQPSSQTPPQESATSPSAKAAQAEKSPAAADSANETAATMVKPKAIAEPAGGGDDLSVLNGVGPKLAEALKAEGIHTYAQIAAWTPANTAWADENLPGVPGRASRNGWVAQAAELAK